MNIAGLLKSEKTVEIKIGEASIKVTVRKYPYGFYSYLTLKALEGKELQYKNGKLTKVESFGTYDIDFMVDQLINGLSSWEITDTNGYAIPLTRENCLSIVKEYPELAEGILNAISDFNSPAIESEDKKK